MEFMVYIVREAPVTRFVIFIRIEYFSEHLLDYLLNYQITDKTKLGSIRFLLPIDEFL